MWVRAMHKYHFVARGVAPKRERLRIASEELTETQRILAAAKGRLADVEEGIATLQAKYDDCVRKKEELENKCEQCEARLGRADKVTVVPRVIVDNEGSIYASSATKMCPFELTTLNRPGKPV